MSELLRIENLSVSFASKAGRSLAVDDLNFSIHRSESVALVGESGSGKSVTALSILNLISSSGGRIESGSIWFDGQDLAKLSQSELRKVRGRKIGMIFQEPMTSLNPVFTVGDQIAEVFQIHQGSSARDAKVKAIDMLNLVKIPAPEQRFHEYPHQLSGGMRQRVMIAIALACKPKLLVADEPTTALDVTIQAQIMNLILDLQKDLGMAVLLITHDLAIVAETSDRVLVMYGGRLVETARVEELFHSPRHPYTQGLLKSIPKLGEHHEKLYTIEGTVPGLGEFPPGCKFRNRCQNAFDPCVKTPELIGFGADHLAACWLYPKSQP